jgi:hypothetical protein
MDPRGDPKRGEVLEFTLAAQPLEQPGSLAHDSTAPRT